MSENGELQYKIGIVGPTRVGKTSLIASILEDSQRLLAQTPLSMKSRTRQTELRIAEHRKQLQGSLVAKEFTPGGLEGTQAAFTFELQLEAVGAPPIHLGLCDYPGRWLDAGYQPPDGDQQWDRCKRWIAESTVLVVPVEAAVLMEAERAAHKRALPFILTIPEVDDVAREWARGRHKRPDEPALLLLCPVKCESYFNDNGGDRSRAEELFGAVQHLYHDVVDTVRREAPHAKLLYAPVDTIGCVDIMDTLWREHAGAPGGFDFQAKYRVRAPYRRSVKGADAVLVALCEQLVEARRRGKALEAKQAQAVAGKARENAERDEGFLRNAWMWLSGERTDRRNHAKEMWGEAEQRAHDVRMLEDTIAKLAARDLGPRVRKL